MSGECYTASNIPMEITSSRKEKIMEKNDSKYNPDENTSVHDLIEYETIVTSTQNKSNELKEQIDRIKQFYTKQTLLADSKSKTIKGKFGSEIIDRQAHNSIRVAKKVRQNSQAIGTDTPSAVMGTIGNIIAGIIQPIKTSDWHPEIKRESNSKNGSKLDCAKISQIPVHGVEDVKINAKSKEILTARSKTKVKKTRSKVASLTSVTDLRKYKKVSNKNRLVKSVRKNEKKVPKADVPIINKRSKKTILKFRSTNQNSAREVLTVRSKCTTHNPDLVEIYHNNAVKETKSSESDMMKRKPQKNNLKSDSEVELIPPLPIEEQAHSKALVNYSYSYNYTMPTISSRMKRVAKHYMTSYNMKSIPFCLTTSTSPSHNIGINIQQVMSMVKTKQPVGRLSPTLAYNIGLAAGRDYNQIPFMVSSVTSKNFYPSCPLSKSSINYHHLQEIAKTIPEETIEEAEENDETNSPETQSMIITGPSGDIKVTNKKHTVWTANNDEKKCTCITPKGVDFQQLINKFNINESISKFKHVNCNQPMISMRAKRQRMENVGSGEQAENVADEAGPLQSKERRLKEVLKKLHDEFAKMSKTYDELAKKTDGVNTEPEIVSQLESLDKELNSKEEEIVMVMTLYKEVLALKKQVKTLKNRTSRESITAKMQHSKPIVPNATAANLLNKLLQRVQHFQTHYKKPLRSNDV